MLLRSHLAWFLETGFFIEIWGSSVQLGWPASKVQGNLCVSLVLRPQAQLACLAFNVLLRTELRSP